MRFRHHSNSPKPLHLILSLLLSGLTPLLSGCLQAASSAVTPQMTDVAVEIRDAPKPGDKKGDEKPVEDEGPVPLVIPHPKRITTRGASAFTLNETTRIITADQASAEELRGAHLLAREIERRTGLKLPVVNAGQAGNAGNAIVFGGPTANPLTQEMQRSGVLPGTPDKAEGYAVGVTSGGVAITGHDATGMLWGAQTVVHLLRSGSREIQAASITDWPSLSLRAVHLFYGKEALPFHKKLISNVYSPFKLNAMFIESEQVRWNHDPGAAPDWAGTPEQIREQVAFAREQGVTVYPLVQGYGHLQYILGKGDRKRFAEDPNIPYALCFTDPAAVAYWDGIMAEADNTFGAPAFHIGLDEVVDPVLKEKRGQFPGRSKGKTFSELYLTGANHWYQFFKARNKPVFMWADQAFHPADVAPDFGTAPSVEEAKKIRDGLPRDIIMCTWQYTAREAYPSLKKLKEAGFQKVVAATWFTPGNIQNFTRAAAEVGALGVIQTTWAGYESKESVLQTEKKQFVAMVLAAEYFWNGGEGPTPNKLPYDPEKIFDSAMRN